MSGGLIVFLAGVLPFLLFFAVVAFLIWMEGPKNPKNWDLY